MSSYAKQIQTFNSGTFTTMNEFQFIQKLGTGSFGSVNLYLHKPTQKKYAIKIMPGETITNQCESEGIEREIRVHKKCRNPNIVQLYDSFYENDSIFIVIEYLENGNLFTHIQKNPPMSEQEACKYFVQTCLALQYMHQNNIFHRDIKPENLLLDEKFNLKVCDFGWCAENIHQKRKTFCGTYEYMAPEIVMEVMYDYKIDLWSLGILLYELLHKYAPFKGKDFKEISLAIRQGQPKIKPSVSKEAFQLISQLLSLDPNHRPPISQILTSSFVKKYSNMLNLVEFQENIQPRSPLRSYPSQQQLRCGSPRRRITEYNIMQKPEQRVRMASPKPIDSQKLIQKIYVSPARRIQPKGRENVPIKTGPIDVRGREATKIIYMNLCNNIS
ncbi:unnamed protein product [Paramecium octaurelia]|uniref:Aurora kinase n=1 Tax=Paramecium octaurelia TaxID=43137 RepID=A0A8S1T143_PAROT|nr:unnamed protein product [Paramecium octaurelia]